MSLRGRVALQRVEGFNLLSLDLFQKFSGHLRALPALMDVICTVLQDVRVLVNLQVCFVGLNCRSQMVVVEILLHAQRMAQDHILLVLFGF